VDDLKLEIGQEVVFNATDGYPDRARFLRMEGNYCHLRHRLGILTIPREDILSVVKPKPEVLSEIPITAPWRTR
jgi:hypothetical protein